MASMRAAAAKAAMERPQRSSNDRTNRPGRRESGYNAQPNAPGRRPSGYNDRPNEPQPPERGYNAQPAMAQPFRPAANNNERSNPPGSAPPNRPDTGNTATAPTRTSRGSAEVANAGRETIPLNAQEEPRPAQTAQPIGGDRFARASARARARIRGGVTS
jgi:hypothetical protein